MHVLPYSEHIALQLSPEFELRTTRYCGDGVGVFVEVGLRVGVGVFVNVGVFVDVGVDVEVAVGVAVAGPGVGEMSESSIEPDSDTYIYSAPSLPAMPTEKFEDAPRLSE